MAASIFEQGLDKNPANYVPQTPLTFIERAAVVYPEKTAVIHGSLRRSWAETYRRCRQLASALAARGVARFDTVAVMLPNTPPMVECHFGIPMLGAVLCSLNTRLDASAIAFMLEHGEAKAVIVDREFSVVMSAALKILTEKGYRLPLVIDADDSQYLGPGERIGAIEYDDFVAQGSPEYEWQP